MHGEVHAGDGAVWLHREAPEHRMVSPLTTGTVNASLAVLVDDVDAHHARVAATGAAIDYQPTDMPYGVREYSVRHPRATSGHSRHRSPSSRNRDPMTQLTSYPCVADARAAIEWCVAALGAEVTYEPIVMDDGRVGHCELAIGEARWMMSDPFDSAGVAAPDPARGSAVSLHLTVTTSTRPPGYARHWPPATPPWRPHRRP